MDSNENIAYYSMQIILKKLYHSYCRTKMLNFL